MKFDGEKAEQAENEIKEARLREIDKKTGSTKLAQDFRSQLSKIAERKTAPAKITESRCRVCQHQNRDYIDSLLAPGNVNLSKIARTLPPLEDGKKVTRRSLASHAKNHLNVADGVMREIMVFEAERAGRNHEDNVLGAFTYRGALEVAIQRAFEGVANGTVEVEPKDMLAMIKMIREMDEEHQAEAVDQARATVNAFVQAIMQHVDAEKWSQIARTTESILKGSGIELSLIADAEVVDAEPVPELGESNA